MNLTEIKQEKCPVCGSEVTAEVKNQRHTNGHYNEYRTFACGCSLHYIPNFERVEVEIQCPNSPNLVLIKEKRDKAIKLLERYINRLDVDDFFKKYVKDFGLRRYIP